MTPGLLVAALLSAAPEAGNARVFLSAAAAAAPACKTARVDDRLVRATLFSADSEACPVARVGGETIALRELAAALEGAHLSRSPRATAPATRPDMDFAPALERLVTTRLLVLEAREMRLDESAEFKDAVAQHRASRLRAILQREAARGARPDAAEVKRLYEQAVREWAIASVLVDKEDDAKAFRAALDQGAAFDALAKKLAEEKKGKGSGKAEYASRKHLLPEIVAAVEQARTGAIAGPLQVASGWVVLRVEGTRLGKDDPEARAEARARSLARVEQEAVRRYYDGLVARYARVDRALLAKLDFEAGGEKGFEALLKDARPVATIRGDRPVTVGDLAGELAGKFFHGLASPIEQRRVNPHKQEAFERLLGARLFAREAAARRLEARPDLRREVEEYERGLAFATFVEKVLAPEVKVTEAEAVRWYEAHQAEYTAPEMVKLDGMAFATAPEAQAALDKLKAGTDFAWFRTTAPGQLPLERRSLQLDGRTVSVASLPPELASALAGARSGEYRLHAPRAGEVYVLRVVERTAAAPKPYAEAREAIAKRLFGEKLGQAIRDYADKLRKAQRVEVLVTRIAS